MKPNICGVTVPQQPSSKPCKLTSVLAAYLLDATPQPSTSDVRSPTRTSTEVRSPTSTSTEVRSPTSTSTEVRSPTSTSTDAYTQGNITVTGGAGAGCTSVTIYAPLDEQLHRADEQAHLIRSKGAAWRMPGMMRATGDSRTPSPMSTMFPALPGSKASWLVGAAITLAAVGAGYAVFRRRKTA